MVRELFLSNITVSDKLYRIIRDEERCSDYKHYLESLWQIYEPYADTDFPQQLAYDFNARFWEMYLTCTLIQYSFNVIQKQTKSKGPDILIDDSSRKIFIEAVTPSQGANGNIDRVPRTKFNTFKVERLPDTEILLRYTSAIADKYNKYIEYLEDGIVSYSDSYVIALNSCKIGILAKAEVSGLPRIIKAVLPVGYKQVTIDKTTGPIVPWRYEYRPAINRSSGSSVPTNLFLEDEYSGLSGILYAHSDIANRPDKAGDEFVFIHNPKSTQNAIPHELFNLGIEYYVELRQNDFIISWKDWRSRI